MLRMVFLGWPAGESLARQKGTGQPYDDLAANASSFHGLLGVSIAYGWPARKPSFSFARSGLRAQLAQDAAS
jgi:hypothetical protein